VNCVSPGYIQKDAGQHTTMNDSLRASAIGRIPLRRFGRPEEVAAAIAFLLSKDASYITVRCCTSMAASRYSALNNEDTYVVPMQGIRQKRVEQFKQLMRKRGLRAILISGNDNFHFFTNIQLSSHYWERPFVLVIPAEASPSRSSTRCRKTAY